MHVTFKKINETLSWLLLICAFICFILSYIVVSSTTKTGEMAFVFGYRPFHVVSDSMEPYLKTNGFFLAKEVNAMEDIAVGDVILFHFHHDDSNVTFAHRIISIDDGIIETKGDNNAFADNIPLTIDDVEAKVVLVFNQPARLISLLETALGKILIFCLAFLFIFVCFLVKTWIKNMLCKKTFLYSVHADDADGAIECTEVIEPLAPEALEPSMPSKDPRN